MEILSVAGIVDAPSTYEDEDSLGTAVYASALVEFIDQSNTPITVGIQGEWGSGKTSLLNTIWGDLEAKGQYKQIWINSWEHSLLRLRNLLSERKGGLNMAKKAKLFTGSMPEFKSSKEKRDWQKARGEEVLKYYEENPDKELVHFNLDD